MVFEKIAFVRKTIDCVLGFSGIGIDYGESFFYYMYVMKFV